MCVMMDGCSINTNAANNFCKKIDSINVERIRCLSQFVSLVGRKLERNELNKSMKYLNMIRQSPKARRLYRLTFNIDMKSSWHIRWFTD